jgi:uncharacterized protein (UPF0264 family)
VLHEIARAVAGRVPLSVALGDPADPAEAARAVSAALEAAAPWAGPLYLKLGLARARHLGGDVLGSAVETVADAGTGARVIVTAYADHTAATAREVTVRLAAEAGAHGVLLDTWDKNGRTLFDHVSVPGLRAWIDRCRAHGLLVALAGSLDQGCVHAAAVLGPDVVGVRGAACNGGRAGRVDAERVRRLRDALGRSEAGTQVAAGT